MPPNTPNDERIPDPAGVEAGPQGGPGGAGGEPKGATLESQDQPHAAPDVGGHRREHASDTAQPGYRARPAGQSGVGRQAEDTSPLDGPQGEGNYLASDRGDLPLRHD